MTNRPITPYRRDSEILTGKFDVSKDYATWRPAGTNDYLLILTLGGAAHFGSGNGGKFIARPNDLVLLHPGTLHDYSTHASAERWKLVWVHFDARADWADLLHWPVWAPGLEHLAAPTPGACRAMSRQFFEVHAAAVAAGALHRRLAINALERLLLLCHSQNPLRTRHAIDERVQRVIDYVPRNLSRPLTLSALADVAGLSVSRLGHRFREVIHHSPMEFVEQVRVDRAKQLLTTTGLSIKEVAAQVGYDGQFYFSLRFKKRTGKNPSAYREMFRQ